MNRPSSAIWRPQTTFFIIGGLVVILIALVVGYIANNFTPRTPVRIGDTVYNLRIADTEAELEKGLSGIAKLRPNGGLLMKFDQDNTWGIWMKDMKIPLDIVWLDKNKTVVYMVKDASPDLSTDVIFTPKQKARYVLELDAGSIDKSAIKTGSVATFDETDSGDLW